MSRIFLFSAVCLLTLKLCLAQSQLGTGAINGEVSDPSGKSVAAAVVTVVNTETELTRKTTTSSAGQFSVPVLPPGNYSVRIEKPGFAVLEWKHLVVNVGSSASVIATLKLGAVQQVIKVEATPTIETTKTEEASLVSRTEIQDLPLNGRRYDQFALLTPGVTRDATFGLLSFRRMSGVWNNFMGEGSDDNQAYNSEARGRTRVASNLSFDAIQEFQVGRSNFVAEFGRAVGGNINAVVRSGGNSFHADGFYYYKDRNLSPRDPFASFKPFERRQQFGGSVGGPIKRDKLFFFANYDQQIRDWPLIFQDTNGVLTQGRPSPSSPTYQADLAAFNAGVNLLLSKMPGGDLRGNGHTVVRFGYGMFFSPTPLGTIDNVLRQTGLSDPTKALLQLTFRPTDPGAPTYLNTFSQLPTGGSAQAPFVTRMDPGFRRPRAQEVNVGVERLLPGGITLSASYIYTKGDRLPFNYDTNLPLPNFTRTYQLPDGTTFTVPFSAGVTRTAAGVSQNVNASRPNPTAGQISVIRPLGLSWYNAFLLEARRRLSKGFEFHIAYTLARAEDVAGTGDGSGRGDEGPFGGFTILDQFNIEKKRSRASTDQGHRLVASAVWNLPFGRRSAGPQLSGAKPGLYPKTVRHSPRSVTSRGLAATRIRSTCSSSSNVLKNSTSTVPRAQRDELIVGYYAGHQA